MLSSGQESQISGKKQIILNFVQGSQGVSQEPPEVRIRATAAPFCNIRRDGDDRPQELMA
jgi:hypothetical protein